MYSNSKTTKLEDTSHTMRKADSILDGPAAQAGDSSEFGPEVDVAHPMSTDGSNGRVSKGQGRSDELAGASSSDSPWSDGIDLSSYDHAADVLGAEVRTFTDKMSPAPYEVEMQNAAVARMATALLKRHRDVKLFIYGSSMTGLKLPNGDLDVVAVSQAINEELERHAGRQRPVLIRLANLLSSDMVAKYEEITVVDKAEVPLLKFETLLEGFSVNMSFGTAGGVLAGQIINRFLAYPGHLALRALVLVVKCFLGLCGLNDVYTGGINSYSIICLVVSFLQLHPKIRRGEIDPDRNIGVLTIEFFAYYAFEFDYDVTGISIYDGGSLFDKQSRGYTETGKLATEDPLNAANDISKKSFGMQRVRSAFAAAHILLTAGAYQCQQRIDARDSGPSNASGPSSSSHGHGILSCIVYADDDMLNHRRRIQKVYNDSLQRRASPGSVPDAEERFPPSKGTQSLVNDEGSSTPLPPLRPAQPDDSLP